MTDNGSQGVSHRWPLRRCSVPILCTRALLVVLGFRSGNAVTGSRRYRVKFAHSIPPSTSSTYFQCNMLTRCRINAFSCAPNLYCYVSIGGDCHQLLKKLRAKQVTFWGSHGHVRLYRTQLPSALFRKLIDNRKCAARCWESYKLRLNPKRGRATETLRRHETRSQK